MNQNLTTADPNYSGTYECEHGCGLQSSDFARVEEHEKHCHADYTLPENSLAAQNLIREQDIAIAKAAELNKTRGDRRDRGNRRRMGGGYRVGKSSIRRINPTPRKKKNTRKKKKYS